MVSSSHSSATHRPTSLVVFMTGGGSNVKPSKRRYSAFQLLSTQVSWRPCQLLTPSPSTNPPRRKFSEAKITAHAGQPKRVWATFKALLGRGRKERYQDPLPFTADDYLSAFTTKVLDVRKDTANSRLQFFLLQLSTCLLWLLSLRPTYAAVAQLGGSEGQAPPGAKVGGAKMSKTF